MLEEAAPGVGRTDEPDVLAEGAFDADGAGEVAELELGVGLAAGVLDDELVDLVGAGAVGATFLCLWGGTGALDGVLDAVGVGVVRAGSTIAGGVHRYCPGAL